MEPQQIIQQFYQLPVEAQRVVADLIELLSKKTVGESNVNKAAPVAEGTGAYPENEFMNPEFYGAWADRSDITDSTEYVRALRQAHWKAK